MAPFAKDRCDSRVACRRAIGSDRNDNVEVIDLGVLLRRHRRVGQVGSHSKRRLGIRQWPACRLAKTAGTKGATAAQLGKTVAQRREFHDTDVKASMGSEVTTAPRNTREADGGANSMSEVETHFEGGNARSSVGGEATIECRSLTETDDAVLVGEKSMDGEATVVSSSAQKQGTVNMSDPVHVRSLDIRDTCVEFLNTDDRAAAAAAGVLSRLCDRHKGDELDVGGIPTDVRPLNNLGAGEDSKACGGLFAQVAEQHSSVPVPDREDRAAAAAAGLLSRLQARISAERLQSDVSEALPARKKHSIALDAVEAPGDVAASDGKEHVPTQLSARNPRLRDENADFFEMEERAAAAAAGLLLRLQAGRKKDTQASAPVTSCRSSRVKFNMDAVTVHAVTPYAEIYGRHPRRFVFDKDNTMIPSAHGGFVSLRSLCSNHDEEEDDEEDGEGEQMTLLDDLVAEANGSQDESVI